MPSLYPCLMYAYHVQLTADILPIRLRPKPGHTVYGIRGSMEQIDVMMLISDFTRV